MSIIGEKERKMLNMDMGKEEKSSNQPTRLASQRIGGWKDLKKFVCVRKTWSWKEESSLEDPAA